MLPRLRPLLLILIWSLGGIVACAQETTSAGSRPAPTATPTLPKPNDPALNKYFHEPKANDLDHLQQLGHHDARYFHGLVSEEERIVSLTHMTRAYLNTFQELGLETWIAHGALLGWWWNAKILPWDWDVDTQVSEATLRRMGDEYNQTTYKFTSEDGSFHREYLLDVNPWSRERVRGDGANIIDARWIDTSNGLYIDITGLSELRPEQHPGVVSCKNFHNYPLHDLYPLRHGTFEGAPALIPYAYMQILAEEYQSDSLVQTNFYGHQWHQDRQEWILDPSGESVEK